MVCGRRGASDHGVYGAGAYHLLLRGGGVDSVAYLLFCGYLAERSTFDIYFFERFVPALPAQMAQGDIHRSC